jgi:hypothetical protein
MFILYIYSIYTSYSAVNLLPGGNIGLLMIEHIGRYCCLPVELTHEDNLRKKHVRARITPMTLGL